MNTATVGKAGILAGLLVGTYASAADTKYAAQPVEVLFTNDSNYQWGESQIAVNPKDTNNIVINIVGPTDCSKPRPGCETAPSTMDPPVPGMPGGGSRQLGFYNDPEFVRMDIYASFDRGKTWERHSLPRYPVGFPRLYFQGDPGLTVTSDGTFWASWDSGDWGTPKRTLPSGGIAVSFSKDGGKTWSPPRLSGTPLDGPKIEADPQTGTVYVHSSTYLGPRSTGNPDDPMGTVSTRWVASTTDGVAFTGPHAIGGGGGIVAAHGVAAAAFMASKAKSPFGDPNDELCGDKPAPCTIFQTSTDAGKTWTRHVVPVASDYSFFGIMSAADPTRPGHFAIAVMTKDSTKFNVYQTKDSGKTWTGPAVVTDDASTTKWHSSMAYSPDGVLGMSWRSSQGPPGKPMQTPFGTRPGPQAYNVWAAISRDGGGKFSKPLKLSSADSPAPKGASGDDYSDVALDKEYLYASWADWRPGVRGGYFGVVRLDAFKP